MANSPAQRLRNRQYRARKRERERQVRAMETDVIRCAKCGELHHEVDAHLDARSHDAREFGIADFKWNGEPVFFYSKHEFPEVEVPGSTWRVDIFERIATVEVPATAEGARLLEAALKIAMVRRSSRVYAPQDIRYACADRLRVCDVPESSPYPKFKVGGKRCRKCLQFGHKASAHRRRPKKRKLLEAA